MLPILNLLAAMPWRLIGAGVLAFVLFVGGCEYGERRVTARWDAEKVTTAQAVAMQAERVATVTTHQSTINQEISNEYQSTKTALAADRGHLLARVPVRVRITIPGGASAVPKVSAAAARTDAAPTDPVPAAGHPDDSTACEQLAEDAARTTLMVVEFQRWYREQADNQRLLGQ